MSVIVSDAYVVGRCVTRRGLRRTTACGVVPGTFFFLENTKQRFTVTMEIASLPMNKLDNLLPGLLWDFLRVTCTHIPVPTDIVLSFSSVVAIEMNDLMQFF